MLHRYSHLSSDDISAAFHKCRDAFDIPSIEKILEALPTLLSPSHPCEQTAPFQWLAIKLAASRSDYPTAIMSEKSLADAIDILIRRIFSNEKFATALMDDQTKPIQYEIYKEINAILKSILHDDSPSRKKIMKSALNHCRNIVYYFSAKHIIAESRRAESWLSPDEIRPAMIMPLEWQQLWAGIEMYICEQSLLHDIDLVPELIFTLGHFCLFARKGHSYSRDYHRVFADATCPISIDTYHTFPWWKLEIISAETTIEAMMHRVELAILGTITPPYAPLDVIVPIHR
jgi:hypothetical protein